MDRLDRARETAGGTDHPVPGRDARDRREPPQGSTPSAARSRTSWRCAPSSGPVAAHEAGRFADELVPVTVPGRRGKPDVVVDRDEHPRPDTTARGPGRAASGPASSSTPSPPSPPATPAGRTTAPRCAWSPPAREAERRGLRPLLALRSWAVAGVGPEVMGIGPVPATAAALDRAGLTLDEIDLIELNEAFAAQVLAVPARVEGRPDRRAAQPQRLRHLPRPPGRRHRRPHPGHAGLRGAAPRGRYVLETMCIGGGQGLAAVFEAACDDASTRSVAVAPPRRSPTSPAAPASPSAASAWPASRGSSSRRCSSRAPTTSPWSPTTAASTAPASACCWSAAGSAG